MRYKWHKSCLLALLFTFTVNAESITEQQYSVIKKMGDLNGIALNCRYLNETQRMKKALVAALPKIRQFGEAFDTETNTAFLKFIEQKSSCPAEDRLSIDVDQAIIALDRAFKYQQK
ncbi:hypothetical protein [Sedimenticola selenatireducens]|uniref:Uncharacterized protein n=1 Tax=Sedimenticola selenatireducens TaxID=191960 RepID=A0A558DQF8_9GAMM|nr:hypothetical protein [Sedimenticola selenatireducens]TVO72998.1 hypothetical protein FHP88_12165 [Sedimenticola selenatireducens]TVT63242.1 MAG: hypothetical protein FHK78_12430 [Sedimenticola selenatireducens]